MTHKFQQLQVYIVQAIHQQTLKNLILSQCKASYPLKQGLTTLKKVNIRLIKTQNGPVVSFNFQHQQQDIIQNYSLEQAIEQITNLCLHFKQINLLTLEQQIQFKQGKKSDQLIAKQQQATTQLNQIEQHNREKNRYIAQDSLFLQALGISDQQHQIIPSMSKKWKQINKFIEILAKVLPSKEALHIVDFGSGKGYLTFALYEYLRSQGQESFIVGVELRHHLVQMCKKIAQDVGFKQLDFFEGDVRSYQPKQLDVMIALHACDIATDFAIYTGIRLNAKVIVCSPCCHKELRQQIQSPAELQPMLQFGIHIGQQAEMLTDSIRALLLQAYGYETKVFEFISLEHTSKNKMILAVKKKQTQGVNQTILNQIRQLKQMYHIQQQTLEQLLITL